MTQGEDDTGRLWENFAALAGSIPQLVWLSEEGGQWTWASSKWEAYTGLSDDVSRGRGWLAAIPTDERELVIAAWRDAPLQDVFDVEHGLICQADGETRRFHTHATPLPARPGHVRAWLCTCTVVRDDTSHKESRRHTLHVIALMRLVLRQLPKADGAVQEFALRIESRIDALARTQAAMAHYPGAALDLEQIITEEAMLHMVHESGQIQVDGPAISVLNRAASTFGLFVHELMENSVINGSLSEPEGCVSVKWQVDQGDLLRFEWLEKGFGAQDGQLSHSTFGQGSIGRMLADKLEGRALFEMVQSGARCTIIFPLKANAGQRACNKPTESV